MEPEMTLPGYRDSQVEKTLGALTQYIEKKGSNDVLASEGEPMDLQIGVKKIVDGKKRIKISLPHRVLSTNDEVCLFVKDIDLKDADETERHFKDMLREKKVTGIAKVIPLRRIKTAYKEYEAKRNLSNLYSGFLADDRIVRLLPGFLGKAFFKGPKVPTQINLKAADLNAQVHSALHTVFCHVKGRGSSCQVNVASTHLSQAQNAANIRAAVSKILEEIPGGAANIKTLYLRSEGSPAIPLYVSSGSADDVELPRPQKVKRQKGIAEDVTPIEGAKIIAKGNADFKIVKIRKSKKSKGKPRNEEEKKVSEKSVLRKRKADSEGSADEVELLQSQKVKKQKGRTEVAPMEGAKIIAKGNADVKIVKIRKSERSKGKPKEDEQKKLSEKSVKRKRKADSESENTEPQSKKVKGKTVKAKNDTPGMKKKAKPTKG